jgi:uncharacterized protein YdeI (YjbR/CyaY-like superfamily)
MQLLKRSPDLPILDLESVIDLQLWMADNHLSSPGVWLAIKKKGGQALGIALSDAVDEGLCWGWIDSRPNKWTNEKYLLLYTPRKKGSGWSKVNKDKIIRLEAAGRIQPNGYAKIEEAKIDGSWEKLDVVELLTTPPDLVEALAANTIANDNYENWAKSTKRGLLEWLNNAKTITTREKRVALIVKGALINENPLAYKPKN